MDVYSWITMVSGSSRSFAVVLGASLAACGCVVHTYGGTSSRIALLAEQAPSAHVTILRKGVEGEDCPGGPFYPGYGDYAVAIQRALASVPGANILLNVQLWVSDSAGLMGTGKCVHATGDAARLK